MSSKYQANHGKVNRKSKSKQGQAEKDAKKSAYSSNTAEFNVVEDADESVDGTTEQLDSHINTRTQSHQSRLIPAPVHDQNIQLSPRREKEVRKLKTATIERSIRILSDRVDPDATDEERKQAEIQIRSDLEKLYIEEPLDNINGLESLLSDKSPYNHNRTDDGQSSPQVSSPYIRRPGPELHETEDGKLYYVTPLPGMGGRENESILNTGIYASRVVIANKKSTTTGNTEPSIPIGAFRYNGRFAATERGFKTAATEKTEPKDDYHEEPETNSQKPDPSQQPREPAASIIQCKIVPTTIAAPVHIPATTENCPYMVEPGNQELLMARSLFAIEVARQELAATPKTMLSIIAIPVQALKDQTTPKTSTAADPKANKVKLHIRVPPIQKELSQSNFFKHYLKTATLNSGFDKEVTEQTASTPSNTNDKMDKPKKDTDTAYHVALKDLRLPEEHQDLAVLAKKARISRSHTVSKPVSKPEAQQSTRRPAVHRRTPAQTNITVPVSLQKKASTAAQEAFNAPKKQANASGTSPHPSILNPAAAAFSPQASTFSPRAVTFSPRLRPPPPPTAPSLFRRPAPRQATAAPWPMPVPGPTSLESYQQQQQANLAAIQQAQARRQAQAQHQAFLSEYEAIGRGGRQRRRRRQR